MVVGGPGLVRTDDFSHVRSTRPKAGRDLLPRHASHRLARGVSLRCEGSTLPLNYWPSNGVIVLAGMQLGIDLRLVVYPDIAGGGPNQ